MPDDLTISVGGDLSALDAALSEIPSRVSSAADAVNSALGDTAGVDALTGAVGQAGSAMTQLSGATTATASALDAFNGASSTTAGTATGAAGSTDQLARAVVSVGVSTVPASGGLDQMAASEQKAGTAASDAAGPLTHISESIDTMRSAAQAFAAVGFAAELLHLASSAIEAGGEQERLATSLTLIGGSAKLASDQMRNIDQMSVQLGLDQSTLEQTARKLSAAFGVGEGLSSVLMAAANASAATGQSFESVASSLERVELTGKVSARQLVALGLSWADVAKAAGISVTQLQADLKSGNQDVEASIDQLEAAINTKFGNAAKAQAAGILGQMQGLKSQFETIMEDIGAALAPAASNIVSVISGTVVPAIRSAIDAFNALPGPVKEVSLILGTVLVAAVPLAAGLATLGFALQGVQTLLTGLGIKFGSAAAGAAELAVSETAATGATTALAVSQTALTASLGSSTAAMSTWTATSGTAGLAVRAAVTETEALGSAQIGLASAAGTAGAALASMGPILAGIGIVAAVGAIEQLIQKLYQLGEAKRAAADASAQEAKSLSLLEITMRQQGINIDDLQKRYGQGLISLTEYRQGLAALAVAFREANPYIESAAVAHDRVTAALKKLGQEQTDATAKVQQARAVLDAAKASYNGSAQSMGVLARAQDNLNKAIAEADPVLKRLSANLKAAEADFEQAAIGYSKGQVGAEALKAAQDRLNDAFVAAHPPTAAHIEDLGLLATKQALAANAAAEAERAYRAATAAVANGSGTIQAAREAWDQWAKAAKSAHEPLADVAHDVDEMIAKSGAHIASLKAMIEAYQTLKEVGGDGAAAQLALADALVAIQDQAKTLGLEVTKTGDSFQVNFVEKGKHAGMAVSDLKDEIQDLLGVTETAGISINGKLVPFLIKAGDMADYAAARAKNFGDELYKIPGIAQSSADGVRVLTQSYDENVASMDSSISSINVLKGSVSELTNAETNLDDVMVFSNGHMETGTQLMEQLAASYHDVAAAAASAASAISEASSAEDSFNSSSSHARSGGSGGGRGGTYGASDMLGIYAAAGAGGSTLDAIADAFGLVKIGERQYATPEWWAAHSVTVSIPYTGSGSHSPASAAGSGGTAGSASSAATALSAAAAAADQAKLSLAGVAQSANDTSTNFQTGFGSLVDIFGKVTTIGIPEHFRNMSRDVVATGDALQAITNSMVSLTDSTSGAAESMDLAGAAIGAAAVNTVAAQLGAANAAEAVHAGMMRLADSLKVVVGTDGGNAPGGGGLITALNPDNKPGWTVISNVQAGVVAGQGGINQLSDMITTSIVNKLKQTVGLKL